MMNNKQILIMPDSFKGSLSAVEVCEIMKSLLCRELPGYSIRCLPIADGGEGTVDSFLMALGGQKKTIEVTGPLGEPVLAGYGRIDDRRAVIEMAACAGLPLVGDRRDPTKTTTYGVGQLIRDALSDGAKEILLGLGGSATHDGAAGMLCALGAEFFDENGEAFLPTGGTLSRIRRISTDHLMPEVRKARFSVLCDITNPMLGPTGAAAVFAPQKGADEKTVRLLEQGLAHYASLLEEFCGKPVAGVPGSGAAGGMGGGILGLLPATLLPGIEVLLQAVRFGELAPSTALILTGEGSLDEQSLGGKAVFGIARQAACHKIPVFAFAGQVRLSQQVYRVAGVSKAYQITPEGQPLAKAMQLAKQNLENTVREHLPDIRALLEDPYAVS